MTAISCNELFQDRSTSESVVLESKPGFVQAKRARTHTRSFKVLCDSKWDDGWIALQHPDLPVLFDQHPSDGMASCRSRKPSPMAGATWWKILCEYSTEIPDAQEEDENPLMRPVKKWLEFPESKVPMWKDLDGKPCVNTAGSAYDPPLERTVFSVVYCFEKNVPYFSESSAAAYLGKVNSSTFQGKPARSVMCRKYKPEEMTEKQFHYWKVNLELEYNAYGWDQRPLSRGVYELDEDNKLVRIKDKHGRDVSDPVPLDANGQLLTPDQVLNSPNLLHYQYFKGPGEANFSSLNLPTWQ